MPRSNAPSFLRLLLPCLAGGLLLGMVAMPRAQDTNTDALLDASRLVANSMVAHCEVPCGIYDDHAMVNQMLLDAETISKASAQIQILANDLDAASLNTISRWVMVKEEHSRSLQHTNAWYFLTQRVKAVPGDDPGHADYLERLAAHHAISVNAMKAAQSLSPDDQKALRDSIQVVAPWYPPTVKGADAGTPDGERWRSLPTRAGG